MRTKKELIDALAERTQQPKTVTEAFVDALGDALGEEALGEDGGGAGDLDIFDGAAHFASGFADGFAAFQGDGFGQFFEVLFEAGLEAEEVLDAIGEGRAAPAGEGAVGGVDGGVGLGGRR